jgi:predicted nuclease of predicted toxin-antitoxin system
MKIKLDENLPACLAERLEGLGHDVATPADEGLSGAPDPDI